MTSLLQLWLPIVVAAVLVFVASSLIHMLFKWHNADYWKLANEDEVRKALRAAALPPGQYVLPYCQDMKEMQGEAMLQKYREGPNAFLTVRANGAPAIGKSLWQWFVLNLVIAAVACWLAALAFSPPGHSQQASQLVGIVSFLAYGVGGMSMGIWWGKPWISVAKDLLDALIYAAVSALTVLWLWP